MNQMRHDLGVGVGGEGIAQPDQPGTDALVVLHDTVVHQRQSVAADVRVGIALGGRAVRGPARMCDAKPPFDMGLHCHVRERCHATYAAQAVQAAVDHGQAGRVVAPVLELAQPLEQDGDNVTVGNGCDDSAH